MTGSVSREGRGMGLVELYFVAVGLSMDAFAVAVCKGLSMRRLDVRAAAVIALFFGAFQALMPLVGWALGSQFAALVESYDHWIAFGLLSFIGIKMIRDALREGSSSDDVGGASASSGAPSFALDMRELVMLAVATSIDALAAGVSFAFLHMDIAFAVVFIGAVTFLLSFAGVVVGQRFGNRWEKPAAVAGGIVLVLIGIKILLEGV